MLTPRRDIWIDLGVAEGTAIAAALVLLCQRCPEELDFLCNLIERLKDCIPESGESEEVPVAFINILTEVSDDD